MKLRKVDDLVRHWRRLATETGTDSLRASLAALDAVQASGNVGAIRQALDAVRREGLKVERRLRQDAR